MKTLAQSSLANKPGEIFEMLSKVVQPMPPRLNGYTGMSVHALMLLHPIKPRQQENVNGENKSSNFSRNLDLRIIPAFWTLYFICSAIRSNIGLAQTMNIEKKHDLGHVLHMTPHQISTGLALFYVCYVIFDFPSNLIMSRLSPRAWMSRIVTAVGIIGSCFAAARAAWSI
jgi:hypothetical protein